MMVEVIPILVSEDLSSLMLLPGGFVLAEILGPLVSSSSGASEGEGSGAAARGSAGTPGQPQPEEQR